MVRLRSLILASICYYVREGRIMVRIAVVEDEAVSRQLLADYLARYSEENDVSFDVTAEPSSVTTSRCTTSSSWTSR